MDEAWKPTLEDLLEWEEEDAAYAELNRQLLMEWLNKEED